MSLLHPHDSSKVLWWLCLSVCLLVLAYLRNQKAKLYQIFCACCLWSLPNPSTMPFVIHYVLAVSWMTSCYRALDPVLQCIASWREWNSRSYCMNSNQSSVNNKDEQLRLTDGVLLTGAKCAIYSCVVGQRWNACWSVSQTLSSSHLCWRGTAKYMYQHKVLRPNTNTNLCISVLMSSVHCCFTVR